MGAAVRSCAARDRVRVLSAIRVDTAARTLTFAGETVPCTIGRGGACAAADKREGDGRTPIGAWSLRAALLRPDRVRVPAGMRLPWRWLRPDDGWSDDVRDPAYNHAVRHPHRFSAERMWFADALYDVVVVLAYNDAPPVPGQGSAIFLHRWRDGAPTDGCVAVAPEVLTRMLPRLAAGDVMEIG